MQSCSTKQLWRASLMQQARPLGQEESLEAWRRLTMLSNVNVIVRLAIAISFFFFALAFVFPTTVAKSSTSASSAGMLGSTTLSIAVLKPFALANAQNQIHQNWNSLGSPPK